MSFWMREATLQIGSKVYQMDDLYFEFEVPFEDSDTLQSATFKAYNLAESTRKGIKRGSVIILNAGYEGDIGAIFVGKVSACSHKHDKTNWITSITATAAMVEWSVPRYQDLCQGEHRAGNCLRPAEHLRPGGGRVHPGREIRSTTGAWCATGRSRDPAEAGCGE